MSTRAARLKAQKKYDESHRGEYRHFDVKCHREKDKDVIEYVEKIENKSGFFKELVREKMAGGN